MSNLRIAACLDRAIDAAAYLVIDDLLKFLPKSVRRNDPAVSTTAVILGSLVLMQALNLRLAQAPAGEANFKLLVKEMIPNLRARIARGGRDTIQLLNLIKRLGKVASVSEVQYWMIPYLLAGCGVKLQRAEDSQAEVIRMLQGLVGQVDVLPFLLDAGADRPRERKRNGRQEVLNF
jgi:hypothetical protein